MKTKGYQSKSILVVTFAILVLPAWGQPSSSRNHGHEKNGKYHTSRQSEYRNDKSYETRQEDRTHWNNQNQGNQKESGYRHQAGNYHPASKPDNRRFSDHHPKYHKWDNARHHETYGRHDKHPVYYRNLPSPRYHRMRHGNTEYYHCNHHFYKYHPQLGYVLVDAPFTVVANLPGNFFIKVIHGQQYVYQNGFYYLPVEYGYAMIPEPTVNNFTFVFNLQ